MKPRVSVVLLLGLTLLIFGLSVTGDGYPDLTGESLVVYIVFHEEEGRRLLDLFHEKTNVNYTYLRMPSGEVVTRVIKEASHPRADIILGGPADAHQFLANRGLLEKYAPPAAAVIPEKFKSPDRCWTGIYLGPIAIAINENRWKKEFSGKGIKKPDNFKALLNPAFKNEIIMPDPKTSGTAYTLLASLIQLWGEEEAFSYFEKLDHNVGQYVKSGFTVAQKTATGEYLIGLNFIHDQLLMKKFGFNLSSVVPEGAGWEIGCVSMIKNGPNSKAARAFLDFMTDKEAGRLHTNLTERISTRYDVPIPLATRPLAEIPINMDYDFYLAAKLKTEYLKVWEERIARRNR